MQGSSPSVKPQQKLALLLLLWQFSHQTSHQIPFFITYRVASSLHVSLSPPGSVKYNTHSFFPISSTRRGCLVPRMRTVFHCGQKKKILTTKTSQRRRCSSSAAHTGKLVRQESSNIPKGKYEIRCPERLGHFLDTFGGAFGLLLMLHPRSGCLSTIFFFLFHLPGS